MLVRPGSLAFPFPALHIRILGDATNPSAPRVPVKRWVLGILLACSLRSSRKKIPAILLRTLDLAASSTRCGLFIGCDHAAEKRKGEVIMSDNKKPAAKIRHYPVTAAIWRNENKNGIFYGFTIERSYKDEKGNFKTTSTFNASDALLLAKVADLVDTKIRELSAIERQTVQPDEEEMA
jgi:hypothetical protein